MNSEREQQTGGRVCDWAGAAASEHPLHSWGGKKGQFKEILEKENQDVFLMCAGTFSWVSSGSSSAIKTFPSQTGVNLRSAGVLHHNHPSPSLRR